MPSISQLSDDELLKFIGQSPQNSNQQGDDFSILKDEELLALIGSQPAAQFQETQQPQQPIGRIEAGVETISNIPLVGPRAKAALAALAAKSIGKLENLPVGQESFGDLYDEAFKNEISKLNQARSQYPVQSFATNLVPDLVAGGKALKATKLAGNSFKTALAGGAMLGSAGAIGETKDLRDGRQVLSDALSGAGFGAAGGAAGYGLAKGVSGVGKVIKSGVNMISPPSAQKVLSKIISPEQAGQLATKLETRQAQGRISALPDVGGEKVSALSRTLAKQDGSRESINEFLNNRTATSAKRTAKLVNGKIADQNYQNSLDNLAKAKEELAAPLYQKAYEEGVVLNNNSFNLNPRHAKILSDIDALSKQKESLLEVARGESNITDVNRLLGIVKDYNETKKELKKFPSLLQWIRQNGGIAEGKGELAALDFNNKTMPFLYRKEGTKGVSFDSIAERLHEALDSRGHRDLPKLRESDVLNAVRDEMFGKKTYLEPEGRILQQHLNDIESGNFDFRAIKNLAAVSRKLEKLKDFAAKNSIQSPDTALVNLAAKINNLFADERLPAAIKQARKDFGISSDIPDNSIQALHGARQQVDDIINSAKRAGENNKARSYIELRNKINDTLYEASPTFKKADDTYSGFAKMEQAQKDGLDFDKFGSGDEIKNHLSKLTPDEKDAFKIGLRENLIRRVSGSQDSASGARRIFGNSLQREKIKSVFDNPKDYNDFARKMYDEIRVYDVKQRILGGSRTDINLNDEAQILDKIAKGAVDAKTFGVSNLIMAGKDAISKRYYGINDKNAKELALIITNPKKSIEALRAISAKADKNQKPLVDKFIKDYYSHSLVATSAQRNLEKSN